MQIKIKKSENYISFSVHQIRTSAFFEQIKMSSFFYSKYREKKILQLKTCKKRGQGI